MDWVQLVLLAVVQGITEFLPISSSGHLVLLPKLFGMEDQGVLLDVAVHVGSLFAVLIYFWRDVRDAMIGPFHLVGDLVHRRPLRWTSRLALLLVVATIPIVIFGAIIVATDAMDGLRTIEVIGWTTLVYGVLLYLADRFAPETNEIGAWSWKSALFMGVAQALALVPGTSRSGITMTAGRALGFTRVDSARMSMLMAIPAILAAGAKGLEEAIETGDTNLTTDMGVAAVLAFASAYLALVVMMRFLKRFSFTPFVIYRVILGGVLLAVAYGAV